MAENLISIKIEHTKPVELVKLTNSFLAIYETLKNKILIDVSTYKHNYSTLQHIFYNYLKKRLTVFLRLYYSL